MTHGSETQRMNQAHIAKKSIHDDIDREFAQLKSILDRTEALSEAEYLRAEKRYIRYERIIKPLSQGFVNQSHAYLKANKKNLFSGVKNAKKGHRCSTQCHLESIRKDTPIFDPANPAVRFKASGIVYVCCQTLALHLCGKDRCTRPMVQKQGLITCELTSIELGQQYSILAQGRWCRNGTGFANNDVGTAENEEEDMEPVHGGAAGEDENNDDDCARRVPSGSGRVDSVSSTDTLLPHASSSASALSSSQRRKRQRISNDARAPASLSFADASAAAAAAASSFSAPVFSFQITTARGASLVSRMAAASEVSSQYHSAFGGDSSGFITTAGGTDKSRFIANSVAWNVEKRYSAQQSSVPPVYGRGFVDHSFESIKRSSRELATDMCECLMFNVTVEMLFETKHHEAMLLAQAQAAQYFDSCAISGRQPNRFAVYGIYWTHLHELFSHSLSRFLSANNETDTFARKYFSETMVRVWKICEATPLCCESKPPNIRLPPPSAAASSSSSSSSGGGSARDSSIDRVPVKKRHAHIQLQRVAPAILYHLCEGICCTVYVHKESQRVYADRKSAEEAEGVDTTNNPAASAALIEQTDVDFVPSHRYLKHRLPTKSQLRELRFAQHRSAAQDIVDNMHWIHQCFRSLLCMKPPLTLKQVEQYKLAKYIRIVDEPEDLDGTLVTSDEWNL